MYLRPTPSIRYMTHVLLGQPLESLARVVAAAYENKGVAASQLLDNTL